MKRRYVIIYLHVSVVGFLDEGLLIVYCVVEIIVYVSVVGFLDEGLLLKRLEQR
ncbi:TPA: hypothetical protein I8035_000867 [Legionella pneumophila]|nr:hypothetical protein [Legionella pneumophila]